MLTLIKRYLLLGRKVMTNLDSILKNRNYFVKKGPSNQGYSFSSIHVWLWQLDYKESWALKNWHFWTVVLEKTLESLLDCKEIQPVHPKGNQSWVFIGRTDAKAETPTLWPPDVKNWLIWKDPDAGKDWRQEEKGTTEDEMVGWHHRLSGHEFEWTPGVGDVQGGLMCRSSWGHKDCPWLSNWTELNVIPDLTDALYTVNVTWLKFLLSSAFLAHIVLGSTEKLWHDKNMFVQITTHL